MIERILETALVRNDYCFLSSVCGVGILPTMALDRHGTILHLRYDSRVIGRIVDPKLIIPVAQGGSTSIDPVAVRYTTAKYLVRLFPDVVVYVIMTYRETTHPMTMLRMLPMSNCIEVLDRYIIKIGSSLRNEELKSVRGEARPDLTFD